MDIKEEIFNSWRILGHRVQNLNSIVQYSEHLTLEQHMQWRDDATAIHKAIGDLMQLTDATLRGKYARPHQ